MTGHRLARPVVSAAVRASSPRVRQDDVPQTDDMVHVMASRLGCYRETDTTITLTNTLQTLCIRKGFGTVLFRIHASGFYRIPLCFPATVLPASLYLLPFRSGMLRRSGLGLVSRFPFRLLRQGDSEISQVPGRPA